MDIKSSSYADLLTLRSRLDSEHSALMNRFNDIQEQLNAVNVVIALLKGEEMPLSHKLKMNRLTASIQENAPVQAELPSNIPSFSETLKGKTQLEALKAIARQRGGKLRTSDARRLLLKAGLIKTAKNAANIIFNVIRKSEQFKRVSPGVYALIEQPGKTLNDADKIDLALREIENAFGHKSV